MNTAKEIILGLAVGAAAFFIYVVTYGMVAAYLPINFQELTDGMAQEKVVLLLKIGLTFEQSLAALPMALAAYIFMKMFKLKASILFLISSISILLGNYFYFIYVAGYAALGMNFVMGAVIQCMMLWFSLSAPSKSLKNGGLTAAI